MAALESQVLNINKGLTNFTHEIEKEGGENIGVCYQCGTCTGSCPQGRRNALRTRKIMRMASLGLKDQLLHDDSIWYCSTCYTCTDRCPRHVKPTDVIMALRNMATRSISCRRISWRRLASSIKPVMVCRTMMRTGLFVSSLACRRIRRRRIRTPSSSRASRRSWTPPD